MNAATTNAVDVSVETPGGLERRMTVRVPSVEIEREINVRLTRVGRTAKLKGFRPGKIPTEIVQQRYGDQVRQEVITDVIRSSYSSALAQEKLHPASGPSIEPVSAEGDEQFTFRATFEVYPEITLKATGSLSIEKPQVEINDADTDDMLERLRDQRADWRAVERKAEPGDRVIADFVGKIAKEPFPEGEGKEVPIVVGEGQVVGDFDKALRGMVADESKTAKVKFPKDYPVDTLAGKKAVFDITIHRVEEKVLPDVDEKFLETLGVAEGGVEALRERLRNNLKRELAERLRVETRRRALDSLLAANKIDVPKALIEKEISALQAGAMQQLQIEDPEQAPPRENFVDAAQRRVALVLLVQELIRANDIKLDRTRLAQRVEELAAQFDQPAEAARTYRGDQELMAQLEASVLEEQVVDFLLENAKTKEKSIAFKEFMAF
ncbi:MAG: trigger factor [Gammaproteobacteria bacterium]